MDSIGEQPAAICNAEDASPRKPLNSKRMTKQQLIEKVAAKRDGSDAGRGRMMPAEKSECDGGGRWLT